MRLGEAMVKEGLITGDTLARALERQIIFGGRLGTNLVEMGAISEESLAKFLGKVLGVPYAGPEQFEAVPQDALEVFSAEMAGKYTAFPIKRERSRLHLAMKDPNDIGVLDELRFILGMDIKAYIASEIRIVYALEKHYGIKRDLRYISILDEDKTYDPTVISPEIERREAAGDKVQAPKVKTPPPPPSPSHVQPAPGVKAAEPAPPAPAAPAAEPARKLDAAPAKESPPTRPETSRAASAPVNPYEALASPSDREGIAEAVVAAAKAVLSRAVLFMVKGSAVTCWKASGMAGSAGEINITLDAPSIFKGVVEDKAFYKGPVIPVPQNRLLLDALGGAAPLEAVAYPLLIREKVVGVLYGDSGEGSMIKADVRTLGDIMAKASMSLEILILRNKILS